MKNSFIRNILEGLNDLAFPSICAHCESTLPENIKNFHLCAKCQSHLASNQPPFCIKCSRPTKDTSRPICSNCRRIQPQFDFAFSACIYNDFLKKLMHEYKYHGQTLWRHIFVHYMINFVNTNHIDINQFDILIPIPLHPTRRRERGYNQSLLLAEGLSQHFKVPLEKHALKRIRYTKEQTSLSRKKRLLNLKNAFSVKNPLLVKNKFILLIDDLLTTGTTASEAAKTLKEAGTKTVGVFTLATATSRKESLNQTLPFQSDMTNHTLL